MAARPRKLRALINLQQMEHGLPLSMPKQCAVHHECSDDRPLSMRVGGEWTTNAEEVAVAEILKEAGYTTGCVGKWDMSRRRYQKELVPNSQGFDSYYGTLGANDGNKVTLYENRNKIETTEDMAGLSRLLPTRASNSLTRTKTNRSSSTSHIR